VELNLKGRIFLINPRSIRYIQYDYNEDRSRAYIEIVMNGKDENIRIDVSGDENDELYKEIRNKLFRKFGLREEKTYENVIKLFEKGLETKEIANILRIRMGTVIKIIGKYKKE
jgi:DNA-binding NarL/FixJ family response regulator